MDAKGHQIIGGQVFRDKFVHLPDEVWADAVNTERHQFVDAKLSPELRVYSFHELRVGAVNAHGHELIGGYGFGNVLPNAADGFRGEPRNAGGDGLIDVEILSEKRVHFGDGLRADSM